MYENENCLPLKMKLSQLVSRNNTSNQNVIATRKNSTIPMDEYNLDSYPKVNNASEENNEIDSPDSNTMSGKNKKGTEAYERVLKNIRQRLINLKNEQSNSLNKNRVTKQSYADAGISRYYKEKARHNNFENFLEIYGTRSSVNVLRNQDIETPKTFLQNTIQSPRFSRTNSLSESKYWGQDNNNLEINRNYNTNITESATSSVKSKYWNQNNNDLKTNQNYNNANITESPTSSLKSKYWNQNNKLETNQNYSTNIIDSATSSNTNSTGSSAITSEDLMFLNTAAIYNNIDIQNDNNIDEENFDLSPFITDDDAINALDNYSFSSVNKDDFDNTPTDFFSTDFEKNYDNNLKNKNYNDRDNYLLQMSPDLSSPAYFSEDAPRKLAKNSDSEKFLHRHDTSFTYTECSSKLLF